MLHCIHGRKFINSSLLFSFGSEGGGGKGQRLGFSIDYGWGGREKAGTIIVVHKKEWVWFNSQYLRESVFVLEKYAQDNRYTVYAILVLACSSARDTCVERLYRAQANNQAYSKTFKFYKLSPGAKRLF